jgi:predicted RNase H-like HicB family nuclease
MNARRRLNYAHKGGFMKRKFSASIWKEGKWYIAQCLEVDVVSQGRTRKTALNNLAEALELYFEAPRATDIPTVEHISVEVPA